MERRDFVKAMVAASLTSKALLAQQVTPAKGPVTPSVPPTAPATAAPPPPGPVPWSSGLAQATPKNLQPLPPDAVAETTTTFFNPAQLASLRRLSDLLVPPTKNHPGALQAATPEFMDFYVGASPADVQEMYRTGLDRLESDAQQKFNVSFAATNKVQADQLIRPWLRTWINDHPPSEAHERFMNLAHSDIRTATINSLAWSEAAYSEGHTAPESGLYWFPVDPDLRGNRSAQGNQPVS